MRKFSQAMLALLMVFSMVFGLVPAGAVSAETTQSFNLALGKTVTASSSIEAPGGFGVNYLVDGVQSGVGPNGWTSNPAKVQPPVGSPTWVMVDLGAVFQIDHVVLWPRNDNGTSFAGVGFPVDFKIQVSSDKTAWIDVAIQTNYPNPSTGLSQLFNFAKSDARYVRVQATKLHSDNHGDIVMQLKEFEVFQTSSQITDEEAVNLDLSAIDLGNTSAVTRNMKLPLFGEESTNISWVSSNPSVLSNNGDLVQRPPVGQPDVALTLMATVTKGEVVAQRSFEVTVKAKVAIEPEQERVHVGVFWPPVLEFTNDEQYKVIKEANVDFVENVYGTGLDSEEMNLKVLDLAEANGLKILIADPRMKGTDREIQEMAQVYMDHPANGGYYLWDEPSISDLPALATRYNKINAADPDHQPFVNLLPNWAVPNYDKDYVRSWVEKVGPQNMKYLSFDHYPLQENNGFRGDYFNNLETIRSAGLDYGVKTSAYLQSIGIPGAYRRPTASEMEYLAFANLAYGIKNIVWFTYWTPSGRGEPFTNAIIDPEGNKTDLYPAFQQINGKIKNLGQTLGRLDAVQVYHAGSQLPMGVPSLPQSFLLKPTDAQANLIVSHLVNKENGNSYVMIVNKSFTESKALSFTLDSTIKGITEVSGDTGLENNAAFDPQTGILNSTFLPGEGKLFALHSSNGGYYGPQTPETIPAVEAPTSPFLNVALKRPVEASSDIGNWGWFKNNIVDGTRTKVNDNLAGWSSNPVKVPAQSEWISIDLGRTLPVSKVDLWPRNDLGTSVGAGFPLDYKVLVSTDKQNWTVVAERTNAPQPTDGKVQEIIFNSIDARYVKIEATKLRKDGNNDYVFQLCEVEVYLAATNSRLNVQATPTSLAVGGTSALSVGMWQLDGSLLPITGMTFTSLNSDIVTVDSAGIMTGVTPGTATIQVMTADGTDASDIPVTVDSLPTPWMLTTYGSAWGVANMINGPLKVESTGTGVQNNDFIFVNQQLNAKKINELSMTVNRYQIPNVAAGMEGRTGLMMRDSNADNASWIYLSLAPDGKLRMESRHGTVGLPTIAVSGDYAALPVQLKLVKNKDAFTGYYMKNGAWTPINVTEAASTISVKFSKELTGGLAQFSGSTTRHSVVQATLPLWQTSDYNGGNNNGGGNNGGGNHGGGNNNGGGNNGGGNHGGGNNNGGGNNGGGNHGGGNNNGGGNNGGGNHGGGNNNGGGNNGGGNHGGK